MIFNLISQFCFFFPGSLTDPSELKIDLWSLGVLILQCLNGEVPFNGMDLSQYTCDKEIDVGSQIPKGTNLELAGNNFRSLFYQSLLFVKILSSFVNI